MGLVYCQWIATPEQLQRLRDACQVSIKTKKQPCGYYSIDKKCKEADTCSSWAIIKLNQAFDSDAISCEEPKRLQSVQKELEQILNSDKYGGR